MCLFVSKFYDDRLEIINIEPDEHSGRGRLVARSWPVVTLSYGGLLAEIFKADAVVRLEAIFNYF